MPSDPYEIPDETLSTWHTVGNFPDGPLKHPMISPTISWIASMCTSPIATIIACAHLRHAAIVTGQPENFSKWVYNAMGAEFSHPTSIDSTKRAGFSSWIVLVYGPLIGTQVIRPNSWRAQTYSGALLK